MNEKIQISTAFGIFDVPEDIPLDAFDDGITFIVQTDNVQLDCKMVNKYYRPKELELPRKGDKIEVYLSNGDSLLCELKKNLADDSLLRFILIDLKYKIVEYGSSKP